MKLLIVVPYYEPAWAYGGPPRLMSIIARTLAARHRVTVLTTDVLDATHRATPLVEELGGVRVHRFPTLSNTLAWQTKIILPRHYRQRLQDEILAADVVFLSDFRHWLNAAATSLLQHAHKPYALAAFGQLQKPKDWKYPLKSYFDWRWGKRLVQQARWLIAQTEHEALDYQSLGGTAGQHYLMPLMETLPTAQEFAQRGEFRRRYQLNSNTKLLLFVGRLNKLKGLGVLVNSFAQLRQRLPQTDLRLVIVGRDDGYQMELNQLIGQLKLTDYVIQTGPLYGADNAACYLDADYFVFTPTYYEETSLATVRALSFGLPVITTVQAQLPWLDAYQAGYTLENSPEQIVDKLTELLPNDILRAKLSTQAQRLFAEHYERDQVIAQLEHAFEHNLQTIQK